MASLGSGPLSVHQFHLRGMFSRWAPWWGGFAIGVLLGGGLLALGVSRADSGALGTGLVFLAVGLGCLIPPLVGFTRRVRRLEVYPDRLVWWTGEGEQQVPWDEVVSVHRFERITNNLWYDASLTLTFQDGRKAVFDQSLSGFRELANNTQEITTAHLLPRKEAEVRAGGAEFGPLTIKPDGLIYKGEFRRWQDMEYAVSRGLLIVVPAGDAFDWKDRKEVLLAGIPNTLLVLALLARAGKQPVSPILTVPKKDRDAVIRGSIAGP